ASARRTTRTCSTWSASNGLRTQTRASARLDRIQIHRMADVFERLAVSDGLSCKLYRGEGLALLALDLDPGKATDDFVGFSVEVKYPGSTRWGALKNRLSFDLPPNVERPRQFKSTEAPFQKFRWIHVPTDVSGGEFRYRVTAKYMNSSGQL